MTPWHKQPTRPARPHRHVPSRTPGLGPQRRTQGPENSRPQRRAREPPTNAQAASAPTTQTGASGSARRLPGCPRGREARVAPGVGAAGRRTQPHGRGRGHSPQATRLRAGPLAEACSQRQSHFLVSGMASFHRGSLGPPAAAVQTDPGIPLPGHTKGSRPGFLTAWPQPAVWLRPDPPTPSAHQVRAPAAPGGPSSPKGPDLEDTTPQKHRIGGENDEDNRAPQPSGTTAKA